MFGSRLSLDENIIQDVQGMEIIHKEGIMKSLQWLVTGTVGLIMSLGLSPVAAREASTEIPDVQIPRSGCVTYKVNPKRLYAPFKVQVLSSNLVREFLFEDTSDEVFDKSVFDTKVLADSNVTVNYIDRNGQVVSGETESGRSSGNVGDCREEITLNFGLKATAGSFERLANKFSARSYYDAIDPDDEKKTLNDWKRQNDFFVVNTPTSSEQRDPTGPDINLPQPSVAPTKPRVKTPIRKRSSVAGGEAIAQIEQSDLSDDASAIYFNHGDLGFGRDMHMKRRGKNNKNVAFYVTNYRSLQDGIDHDDPIATVAMEYSYGSKKGKNKERYIQFYAFGADGNRIEAADLDGRGAKALPGLCVTCHGGNLPEDVPKAGDLDARFLPFDLNAFDYSESDPAYTRAAQESALKTMNLALLDAFPTDAMTELIQGWYAGSATSFASQQRINEQGNQKIARNRTRAKTQSGSGIHAQTASVAGIFVPSERSPILNRTTQRTDFVPDGWRGDHEELYTEIVAPYCRGCHITRAGALDWSTHSDFVAYAGSEVNLIKDRVCNAETDTMPNAKATYQNMWLSSVDPIDVFTRHGIFTLGANDTCGQGPWARP